jgi:hypothetical protein
MVPAFDEGHHYGNTVAFLIAIGLISFGFVIFLTDKLGSSPIWLAFALVPFAAGAITLSGLIRKPLN